MTAPEDAQAGPAARDVAEALAWMRPCDVAPGDLDDWLRVSPKARLRAATIVRAALAAEPDDERTAAFALLHALGSMRTGVPNEVASAENALRAALACARPAAEPAQTTAHQALGAPGWLPGDRAAARPAGPDTTETVQYRVMTEVDGRVAPASGVTTSYTDVPRLRDNLAADEVIDRAWIESRTVTPWKAES